MQRALAALLIASAFSLTTASALASEVTGELSTGGGSGQTQPSAQTTQTQVQGSVRGSQTTGSIGTETNSESESQQLVASVSGGVAPPDSGMPETEGSTATGWIVGSVVAALVLAGGAGLIFSRAAM